MEAIQTTALLRTARILGKVQEKLRDCCRSHCHEKPSANTDVKNSQRVNNNNNNNNKNNNDNMGIHNPAPVLENATHKLLLDFNIETDQLIPVRRPDLTIINKKKKENLQNSRLC